MRRAVPRWDTSVILAALVVLLSGPWAGAEENQTGFRIEFKELDGDTTTLIMKSDKWCC